MTLALVCEKLVCSSIHNPVHPCVDNAVLGNIIRQTFMLINQSGVWDLGWAWRLLCQWLIAYWCPPHSSATSYSMPSFTHFNMLLGLLFSKLYFFLFFHWLPIICSHSSSIFWFECCVLWVTEVAAIWADHLQFWMQHYWFREWNWLKPWIELDKRTFCRKEVFSQENAFSRYFPSARVKSSVSFSGNHYENIWDVLLSSW